MEKTNMSPRGRAPPPQGPTLAKETMQAPQAWEKCQILQAPCSWEKKKDQMKEKEVRRRSEQEMDIGSTEQEKI